ncbi:unnamed protein product, partial [marine sediment metagenome]
VTPEIAKELLKQKKIKVNISEQELIEKLLEEINMAEELSFETEDGKSIVTIQSCLICPKRVGGCSFYHLIFIFLFI